VARDLTDREDADQAAVLDDGKPPHLLLGHQLRCILGFHVRGDGGRPRGHDLGNREMRGVLSARDTADDDVAIRHDPNEPPVLHHRQRAAVLALHERGRLAARRLRTQRRGIARHELSDFHGSNLLRISEEKEQKPRRVLGSAGCLSVR